jgi:hypothetical protein
MLLNWWVLYYDDPKITKHGAFTIGVSGYESSMDGIGALAQPSIS